MLVVNNQQYLAVVLALHDAARWWCDSGRRQATAAAADTGTTRRHRADGVRDGARCSSRVRQDAPRHALDARQRREAGTARQRLATGQIHPVRAIVGGAAGLLVITILKQVIRAEVTTKKVHSRIEILTKQRHRSS